MIPAPYGRACEACSKAKCRCLSQPGRDTCERCHRLGRECRPGELKRHRRDSGAKARKISRVEEAVGKTEALERRIDQLVASLGSQRGANVALSTSDCSTGTPQQDYLNSGAGTPAQSSTVPSCGPHRSPSPMHGAFDIRVASGISAQDAEACLQLFKDRYLQWSPFVHLPPGATADQLYAERPVFWLSIMLTCREVMVEKSRLDQMMREVLAAEMVVKSHKSIDLLLAVVTCLTWHHHHCRLEDGTLRLSLSLVSHLAMSLVDDLKRPGVVNPQQFLRSQLCRSQFPEQNLDHLYCHVRTMEENRAFLACYMITTAISSALHKIDSLRWSRLLGESLREVEERSECEGDKFLACQVRMQLIVDKAATSRQWESAWEPANDHSHAAMALHISSLQAELQRLRADMEPTLKENKVLRLHALHVELAISELDLSKPRKDSPLSLHQVKLRCACLNTAKAWLDAFLTTPPTDLHIQPITTSLQMTICCAVLFYLTTTNEPGWNKREVQDFDPIETLDRLIEHMSEAAETLGPDDDDTVAAQCQLQRTMRSTWVAKLAEEEQSSENTGNPTNDSVGPVTLDDDALQGFFNAGLWDHEWMSGWPSLGGMFAN